MGSIAVMQKYQYNAFDSPCYKFLKSVSFNENVIMRQPKSALMILIKFYKNVVYKDPNKTNWLPFPKKRDF